jgi:hypothetical protein
MSNLQRLAKLSQNHRDIFDVVVCNPGNLASLLATLVSRNGGTGNVGASFGLSTDLSDSQRGIDLLNKAEELLSMLIDEAHITRSNGDRETAVYRAS